LGYYIETAFWEILYFALFVLSATEIHLHRNPPLRSRVKIIQKAWFPTAVFVGIYGMLQGIDIRGVFGIYAFMPRVVMIMWHCMILIPPITCGHIFTQRLFLTTCKTLSIHGPFDIGIDEKFQLKMVTCLSTSWLVLFIVMAVLMGITNRFWWVAIIWIYVMLFAFIAVVLVIRVRNIVSDTSKLVDSSLDVEFLRKKLFLSSFICGGIFLVSIVAITYQFTLGWNITMDDVLHPDPEVYVPAPALLLIGVLLWVWCTAVMIVHGSIFHRRKGLQFQQTFKLEAEAGLLQEQ
jgi:hypothetical protein